MANVSQAEREPGCWRQTHLVNVVELSLMAQITPPPLEFLNLKERREVKANRPQLFLWMLVAGEERSIPGGRGYPKRKETEVIVSHSAIGCTGFSCLGWLDAS